MTETHLFPFKWELSTANFTMDKGSVFSCFSCGGGSSMGYKLAGYDVVGCNEIDTRTNQIYVQNHHPRINYNCDIRDMVYDDNLPEELFHLDILDGSPPCSTFSMAGNREDDWGKERKFAEGQVKQVLDTLFFEFIALANKLRPKIVIAENVRGLMFGSAYEYVKRVYAEFDAAGYYVTHDVLNSMYMGVPQMRERTIFCAIRKDLADHIPYCSLIGEPMIDLSFNEAPIPFRMIRNDTAGGKELSNYKLSLWNQKIDGDLDCGDVTRRLYGKEKCFMDSFVFDDKVLKTINTTCGDLFMLWDMPRRLNTTEITAASTFPSDFNYLDQSPVYVCGMSVPPVMMAQISLRVYDQWLKYL